MSDNIHDKIHQLIASENGANNYLALLLMQSQLDWSFTKAFYKLTMVPTAVFPYSSAGYDVYVVDILDYSIHFLIHTDWSAAVDYPFMEVDRWVYQNGTRLKELSFCVTFDFVETLDTLERFELMRSIPDLHRNLEPLFDFSQD